MKIFHAVAFFLVAASVSQALEANPIGKVVQLLGDMETKIIKEGEGAQKTYEEYAEWAEDQARKLQHSIKTGESDKAALAATIEEETATQASLSSKVEELAGSVASDEGDLAAATKIRNQEAADFAKEDAELSDVINTLERAAGILAREMSKTGAASMVQLKNANTLSQALEVMVDASMVSSADAGKLTALIQNSDEGAGAPDAAVYKSQSGSIVETIQGLQEEAENQQAAARKKEQEAKHNFEMLKQSLEDAIKFSNKDSAAAKANLASSKEAKATAEGDLEVTKKNLASDIEQLATLHREAMSTSQDFEASTKSRGEELKALATAKKIINDMTAGAVSQSYSFLQVSGSVSQAPLDAVRLVRDLGRHERSSALTQLAIRMSSVIRSNAAGPFDKVVGLIKDMLDKLQKEANEDASHKAYCDKELAESTSKKEEKEALIAKHSTKIDSMSAKSAKLKEQVSGLQKDLANLASSQVEMNKLRSAQHEEFVQSKSDLEQGLEGVKKALQVLREYYGKTDKAHGAASGAGANVIGLLEVCESDFSKGLAEATSTEENAQNDYDKQTKANDIAKTTKTQDVKYKSKESTQLDKSSGEEASDRSSEQAELDAVNDYLSKLNEQCVAKPETYEERKRRREEEIAGLKEALTILSSDASFLQKRRKSFRGSVLRP